MSVQLLTKAPVVNGMFFDRGAAVDYDAWADLGNPGWEFEHLLPYFEKVRSSRLTTFTMGNGLEV